MILMIFKLISKKITFLRWIEKKGFSKTLRVCKLLIHIYIQNYVHSENECSRFFNFFIMLPCNELYPKQESFSSYKLSPGQSFPRMKYALG